MILTEGKIKYEKESGYHYNEIYTNCGLSRIQLK